MHLDRLVGDPGRGLAGVELGHRRRARVGLVGVLEPRGALDQEPRALDAALHLGELELDRLDLRERLAEGVALLRVARRGSSAASITPSACAPTPIRPASSMLIAILNPSPSAPSRCSIGTRRFSSVSETGVRAAQSHLVLGLTDHEPGSAALDDERRDAVAAAVLGSAREDQVDAGLGAVRHPVLAAVENVAVALELARRLQRAGVGAGAGLGQRERTQLAADQTRQESMALLVGAEAEHRQRPDRVVHRRS
jgi:hypothetical protein